MILIGDVDDVFLPSPSDLLANLSNCRDQVVSMLTGELSVVIIIIRSTHIIKCRKSIKCNTDLPELFNGSQETENCLGAALQAAYKMVNKNFPQSSQSSSL